MQQSARGERDNPQVSTRDSLAWHPATRAVAAGTGQPGRDADEATISASMRLVARLEEETHTLTTQLAYLQMLLQQVKDTLIVLQSQATASPPARDQKGRLLGERIASAYVDGYSIPVSTRR